MVMVVMGFGDEMMIDDAYYCSVQASTLQDARLLETQGRTFLLSVFVDDGWVARSVTSFNAARE